MSRVMLLRHASAANALPGMRDFDRPLDRSGREEAAAVGAAMAAAALMPDLVLCSPALRTRETWEVVAASLGGSPIVRFPEELYGSDVDGYLEAIRASDSASAVLVVGHNPMTAETADLLSGHGDRRDLASMRSRYPTSALAVIAFDEALSGIKPGAGTLERWLTRG